MIHVWIEIAKNDPSMRWERKNLCNNVITFIYIFYPPLFLSPQCFQYTVSLCTTERLSMSTSLFLYDFLVCNLSNAQFRQHTKLCPHTHKKKTYCICWMCLNLWVTWVVKSFTSCPFHSMYTVCCFVIVIYLFSSFFSRLLYAWDMYPKWQRNFTSFHMDCISIFVWYFFLSK